MLALSLPSQVAVFHMEKLFVVCPNCKAKYAVADRSIAGKDVSCKKCSQKFEAKVYVAKAAKSPKEPPPPASADPLGLGGSDPFGENPGSEDLFGEMPKGPTLAGLPPVPKKQTSSSGSLPLVPIAMAGGGVLVVAIVIFGVISLASNLGNSSGGLLTDFSNSDEQADLEKHYQVQSTQKNLLIRFLEAVERIEGEQDLPQFVTTTEGLITELEALATQANQLPHLSEANQAKFKKETEDQLAQLKERTQAVGQKLAPYAQNQDVRRAMLDFYQAMALRSAPPPGRNVSAEEIMKHTPKNLPRGVPFGDEQLTGEVGTGAR